MSRIVAAEVRPRFTARDRGSRVRSIASMRTKGTAFLGRKVVVAGQFGEARWNAFVQAYAEIDPFFAQPILATTLIPSESFLAFTDRIVDAFFGGDLRAYWTFGELSGQWALTCGPYQHYCTQGDPHRFAEYVQRLWSAYHDVGECAATIVSPDVVEIALWGVPIHHVYFEFGLIGFLRRGFELVTGDTFSHARIRGFSQGDQDVLYRLKKTPLAG
jgi:hypothetical protein